MGSDGLDGKSMADAQEALEELAQARFAFLLSDTGFARGPTERNASRSAYSYKDRHQTAQIGVQTLLDWVGEFVEVSFVRLESGKWPKLGQYENPGRTIRIALLPLLRDVLLIKDAQLQQALELSRTKRPWNAQLAAQMLDLCHDLLDRYIALVLQQPIDVLFPPRDRSRV
jgi:hypothetical protein